MKYSDKLNAKLINCPEVKATPSATKQTEEGDSLQSSEPEKTAVEISISKEILKMELLK
jgi:hypothetical protein